MILLKIGNFLGALYYLKSDSVALYIMNIKLFNKGYNQHPIDVHSTDSVSDNGRVKHS